MPTCRYGTRSRRTLDRAALWFEYQRKRNTPEAIIIFVSHVDIYRAGGFAAALLRWGLRRLDARAGLNGLNPPGKTVGCNPATEPGHHTRLTGIQRMAKPAYSSRTIMLITIAVAIVLTVIIARWMSKGDSCPSATPTVRGN